MSFFYSYSEHRDLHSFPTRRSSDLAAADRNDSRFVCTNQPAMRRAAPVLANRSLRASGAHPRVASRELWRAIPRFPDRKSTRLNSSHVAISYAVFCLKKKKKLIKII